MISNGEGWHHPSVKKLSALLRQITVIFFMFELSPVL